MNKRIIITLFIAAFLISGTIAAIYWAKGYRPNLQEKIIKGTGLLVTNSYPKGASVYLNDKLTTATDDTLHLPPDDYRVRIIKDGFAPWEKLLKLEPELVTQTNARLFPSVPDLTALTFTGAINPIPSPDGQKIAYAVASASASLKNGLWVINLSDTPLKFNSNNIQISQSAPAVNFSKAQLAWSPNSQQILVSLPNGSHFLLPSDSLTNPGNLKDVSAKLPLILEEWEQELALISQKRLEKLPKFMVDIATGSAKFAYFAPDETKLMYLAKADIKIPENLIPPLPSVSSQKEERNIKPNGLYVYDIKEDKNFLIKEYKERESKEKEEIAAKKSIKERLEAIKNNYSPLYVNLPQWLSTAQHLVFSEDNKINIVEYDSTNLTTVYVGNFEENFLYPWPSGNKLVILTSLSSLNPNLYAINLR